MILKDMYVSHLPIGNANSRANRRQEEDKDLASKGDGSDARIGATRAGLPGRWTGHDTAGLSIRGDRLSHGPVEVPAALN